MLNGYKLQATDSDSIFTMLAIAVGEMDEVGFAALATYELREALTVLRN